MIIRNGRADDAIAMVGILNDIISLGGSTAHQRLFDVPRMREHYLTPPTLISCQIAEDAGTVVGFQSLSWPDPAYDAMPTGWVVIATLVASHAAGKGVGQGLFEATQRAAHDAGVLAIDATIRADNVIGLRYYSGLNFVDYRRRNDIPLRDGTKADRVSKRFDL